MKIKNETLSETVKGVKLRTKIKRDWLEALRSGEYKQGQMALVNATTNPEVDQFCCLGVLCDLAVRQEVGEWDGKYYVHDTASGKKGGGAPNDKSSAIVPSNARPWAFRKSSPSGHSIHTAISVLMRANDTGSTFKQIADWIEKNL
jgi:hypothetical protein